MNFESACWSILQGEGPTKCCPSFVLPIEHSLSNIAHMSDLHYIYTISTQYLHYIYTISTIYLDGWRQWSGQDEAAGADEKDGERDHKLRVEHRQREPQVRDD